MRSERYTERDVEQLLKDYIVQQFMYEKPGVVLENDLLLLEEGIIDSLGILKLTNFIENQFEIYISLSAVVSNNFRTVDAIKYLVISKLQTFFDRPYQKILQKYRETKLLSVVPIKPNGNKRPFFYVHGGPGYNLDVNLALARHIDLDRPFYGIQAIGINEQKTPHTHIKDMVTHYIQEMRVIQPEGPYLLGGVCVGGNIAYEMAQEFKKRGQQVLLLVMVDSPNPFFTEEEKKTTLPNWYPQPRMREELINKGLNLNQVENIFRVWEANIQVIANHTPQLYGDRVVYFSAPEKVMEKQRFDPMQLNGWNSLVAGGIELQEVSGSHLTMHFEPHVRVLAEKLNACLERAEQEQELPNLSQLQLIGKHSTLSTSNNEFNFLANKQLEKLAAHYKKALLIKPDNATVHSKLAKLYEAQMKFEESTYHSRKAIQFDETSIS